MIIGCDRKERVGTLHRVSIQVIKEGREVAFTKEEAAELENVLPGVAVPIRFQSGHRSTRNHRRPVRS
ncbi:sugar diacid recognition domain-containing protein [Siminovitchia fordii]|uniref:sugar diacid recognition domain-containing protein n=1 Tax=Siminovitchia fordii TaxID=254759 RepID=UPI00146A1E94|nr:sugar diacid recognition domain-containing protein [Siminovitchia fordii]